MEIKRVDPFDDEALAAWHAADTAGFAAGREDPPVWTPAERRAALRDDDPDRGYGQEPFAAFADGEIIGAGLLVYPRKDNPALAEVEVNVPPQHRRNGVGSAVFDALAARAARLGRTSLTAMVNQPIGAPEVPGVGFAANRGFTRRNVMMHRVLDLPVPAAALDELDAQTHPHVDDYRVESWQGPCPEPYAEQYVHLRSLILTEAPTGDIEVEPEVWDVARLRAEEAVLAKQDRLFVTSVAVAPDGSLAGHTQIVVPQDESGKSFQWDTLVLARHRGHRLGMALKVANLRIVCERFPDRRKNLTWNAEQNGPMNAVNEKLGFRAVERAEEWQR